MKIDVCFDPGKHHFVQHAFGTSDTVGTVIGLNNDLRNHLLKLRTNLSCFIIAHVGKIPGPNGEEIKGVQIQVSKRIQFIAGMMRKVLVTFQMKNSPSRRSFEERSQTSYAEYVLYGMDL